MIIVYVTCKNKDEAKKIAKHLLDKKLIACANILDSDSLYNWKDKLRDEKESILLMKTKKEKFDEINKEISNMHSYDTPCILKIDVEANSKYKDWVFFEVE